VRLHGFEIGTKRKETLRHITGQRRKKTAVLGVQHGVRVTGTPEKSANIRLIDYADFKL
jgi:hypothetical protein